MGTRIYLFWKVLAIVFLMAVIVFVGIIWRLAYLSERGPGEFYQRTYLSEQVYSQEFNDHTYRVYDEISSQYTTPKLNWVSSVDKTDTTTVFSYKDKRGYLDVRTGKIVIPAQYEQAWKFSEGLAVVRKEGRLGVINTDNEWVVTNRFISKNTKGSEMDHVFHEGLCPMYGENGKVGLIDMKGNWALNPQYDFINAPYKKKYRIVQNGCKYGLLGSDFQWIYPLAWEHIAYSPSGILLFGDGLQNEYDFEGNLLREFVYEAVSPLAYNSDKMVYDDNENAYRHEKKPSDYVAYRISNKWGVMDKSGQMVLKALYYDVEMLSENACRVKINNGNVEEWTTIRLQQ